MEDNYTYDWDAEESSDDGQSVIDLSCRVYLDERHARAIHASAWLHDRAVSTEILHAVTEHSYGTDSDRDNIGQVAADALLEAVDLAGFMVRGFIMADAIWGIDPCLIKDDSKDALSESVTELLAEFDQVSPAIIVRLTDLLWSLADLDQLGRTLVDFGQAAGMRVVAGKWASVDDSNNVDTDECGSILPRYLKP